jgi:hypothetical protein
MIDDVTMAHPASAMPTKTVPRTSLLRGALNVAAGILPSRPVVKPVVDGSQAPGGAAAAAAPSWQADRVTALRSSGLRAELRHRRRASTPPPRRRGSCSGDETRSSAGCWYKSRVEPPC